MSNAKRPQMLEWLYYNVDICYECMYYVVSRWERDRKAKDLHWSSGCCIRLKIRPPWDIRIFRISKGPMK